MMPSGSSRFGVVDIACIAYMTAVFPICWWCLTTASSSPGFNGSAAENAGICSALLLSLAASLAGVAFYLTKIPHSPQSPGLRLAGRQMMALLVVTGVFVSTVGFAWYINSKRFREGAEITIDADVYQGGSVTITVDRHSPSEKLVYQGRFDITSSSGGCVVPLAPGNHTLFVEAKFAYLYENTYPSSFEVFPGEFTKLNVHIRGGS